MAVGGCFCGKVRIEYNGQPLTDYATVSIVASLPGHPLPTIMSSKVRNWISLEVRKKWRKLRIVEIILEIISVPTVPLTRMIGTPLFGRKMKYDGDYDEITIVRAGIFGDIRILNEWKPEAEIYTDRRLKWVNPVDGADQFSGMLSLP
ncbi:uncharacterized protein N7459_008870 [Penicillium hispanicum]|uniref:uncharacterized protein n=1 Tax=Penicillium hispanicum TaxID=1080232 RepID=UPI002541775B|nr:uncharacterized protein N7459_008870 [Penicillium hispanicum]KAJ5569440.1 hypothetical protein N7459_008870 [Penicillium hispanicum]